MNAAKRNLLAFLAGALFSAGLNLGGMTRPSKVLGFLDIAGAWDPSLAFVMAGAVTVTLVAFRFILRRRAPLLGGAFILPARRTIDARLLAGAAIFGIGWGIAGYCPGPAIVSLASFGSAPLLFVGAMIAGAALHHALLHAAEGAPESRSVTAR